MNVSILAALFAATVNLTEVRQLFTTCAESEETNQKLLEMTDGYTIDYKPVVYAYHAAAEMTQANYASWPGTKLSYFNSGKEKLEKVVKKYPKNVEIRYIRFAVQFGSPSFLGYKDDLRTDQIFVLNNVQKTDLPQAQKELMIATVQQL